MMKKIIFVSFAVISISCSYVQNAAAYTVSGHFSPVAIGDGWYSFNCPSPGRCFSGSGSAPAPGDRITIHLASGDYDGGTVNVDTG
ncbi:MAG: hypothetical protein QM642_11990 [Edaphocola sp.]